MSSFVPADQNADSQVACELNNLLQIIAGTSTLIENVWEGAQDSEKYFAMLRASIERAEQVTAQLVARAGGASGKMKLHPELEEPANVVELPMTPARKRSVLVTDDETMALSLLQNVMSQAGYEVTLAQSGFECLDLFRRAPHSFDLVLLDLAMPFMDGEETFGRVRRISPAAEVVLMAGFVEPEQLDRMLSNGLSGFVAKPFAAGDVIALADSVIERARQRRCSGGL
jgi:CheY-like chemotaxis protein